MEASPVLEPSPSPSQEPKGLKGVLAKAKFKKDDASSVSIAATDDSGERNSGIRNSIDSLMRNSARSSVDDGLPSGPSAISKLIPGRAKKKRRKLEEAEKRQQEDEDLRGRSVSEQAATSAKNIPRLPVNQSETSLGEEENNSLITLDSEVESSSPIPPPLVSRDSHSGYLTSSSPLIKTTAASGPPSSLHLDTTEFSSPQYNKSNTLPVNPSAPAVSSNLNPHHAATFANRKGDRSPSTDGGSRSRGVSPGAKLKDALTLGSRRKSRSPPKGSPRTSAAVDGSSSGLGVLLSKEKQRSIDLGKNASASGSTQSLDVDPVKTASEGSRIPPPMVPPPKTPPNAGLEAPETTVTPPTPVDNRRDSLPGSAAAHRATGSLGLDSNTQVSASGNMISHRRIRSDPSTRPISKLTGAMPPPLTPMAEESRTPGSKTPSGSLSGGFFSSVFSAAQNVTNTLTSTITSNPPRPRSSTKTVEDSTIPEEKEIGGEDGVADDVPPAEKKTLAVETLGSGDLSLSHLGIDTPATAKSANGVFPGASPEVGTNMILVQQEGGSGQAEDASVARAVSAAYSEKPVSEAGTTIVAGDEGPVIRPRSNYEPSIATGEMTPPNGSVLDGDHGFKRSSSVRSRVGAVTRKHRNSSSATGGTISAIPGMVSQAMLTQQKLSGSTPKLTGFAVASKKRNRDFHQSFRSVPEDDYLIEDYSCALQRDIILAGRIYVSEGHICFSSNILGWVTTLVISFDEVVSIEKESTAVVFPNAIAIQTLHARHTFRSLLSRDATYELLIGIWKISHPTLKSSVNGVRLDDTGTGDKTEKVEPSVSEEASDASDEEEVYDEDDEDQDGTASVNNGDDGSVAGSEEVGDQAAKAATRKASSMGTVVGAAAGSVPTVNDAKAIEKAAVASAASAEFPGPATHEPTECSDVATHYEKILKDDIIPAPLGKVYSMVFGPASGGFMAKWLMDEIKVTDLNMEDDKKGLYEQGSSRTYTYTKPLYAPIGPKTTKCVVTETLDFIDLERSVSVTASTQTPDVPSGGIFVTKTRFCFMWAPGNQTRAVMNYNIEWSGKSWIKGAIERGATDGQGTYCNDLVKALKAGVAARPRAASKAKSSKAGAAGGKRRKAERSSGAKDPANSGQAGAAATAATASKNQASSWGPLEPLHSILGPIGDILSPFISSNAIIGVLVLIILLNYIRSPSSKSVSRSASTFGGRGGGAYPHHLSHGAGAPLTPERMAAYEAVWAREEADLWDWLEQRVHLHSFPAAASAAGGEKEDDHEALLRARKAREKTLRGDTSGAAGLVRKGGKLEEGEVRIGAREIEEAIRVTEERLNVLKSVVGEEKREREREKEKEKRSAGKS